MPIIVGERTACVCFLKKQYKTEFYSYFVFQEKNHKSFIFINDQGKKTLQPMMVIENN